MAEHDEAQVLAAAKKNTLEVTFRWEGPLGRSCTLPLQYEGIEGEDATAVAGMAGQVATAIESTQPTAGEGDKQYTVSLTWKGGGANQGHSGSARKQGLKYSQAQVLEGFALDGLRRLADMGSMEVLQGERT